MVPCSLRPLALPWPATTPAELEKVFFVNRDFLGIMILLKKRLNYNILKLQQNCVNNKFGISLEKFDEILYKFGNFW